jgi:YggT family protein
MLLIFHLLDYFLFIASWIVFIDVALSWLIAFNVINTQNDMVRSIWRALESLTAPLYRPIRKILPDFGALDLSPLVVLLLINVLRAIVLPDLQHMLIPVSVDSGI